MIRRGGSRAGRHLVALLAILSLLLFPLLSATELAARPSMPASLCATSGPDAPAPDQDAHPACDLACAALQAQVLPPAPALPHRLSTIRPVEALALARPGDAARSPRPPIRGPPAGV